jgi:hypothetical protein
VPRRRALVGERRHLIHDDPPPRRVVVGGGPVGRETGVELGRAGGPEGVGQSGQQLALVLVDGLPISPITSGGTTMLALNRVRLVCEYDSRVACVAAPAKRPMS